MLKPENVNLLHYGVYWHVWKMTKKINFSVSANERARNGGTVILNVGGKIHQVRWETIDKFPKSRLQKIRYATSEGEMIRWIVLTSDEIRWQKDRNLLGNVDYMTSMTLTSECTKPHIAAEIMGLCDSYSLQRREFYFDRSPRIFENILGLYRKGELHLTERVCPRDFLGKLLP